MILARIGGSRNSQAEREPAMQKFRAKAGPEVEGSWRHQCRCGNMAGRLYRGRYWCAVCGTEKRPLLGFVMGHNLCGCVLCRVLPRR